MTRDSSSKPLSTWTLPACRCLSPRCIGPSCWALAFLCALTPRAAESLEIYGNEVAEAAVMAPEEREFAVAIRASHPTGTLPGPPLQSDSAAATLLQLSQGWGLGDGWQAAVELVVLRTCDGHAGLDAWKLSAQRSLDLGDDAPLSLSAAVALSGGADGGWAAELRPVLALQAGEVVAAFNPVVVLASDGSSSMEPCAKLQWQPPIGFALGVEYYAGLGPVDALSSVAQDAQQSVFAGLDMDVAGPSADPWLVHLAVGRPLDRSAAGDWSFKAALVHDF